MHWPDIGMEKLHQFVKCYTFETSLWGDFNKLGWTESLVIFLLTFFMRIAYFGFARVHFNIFSQQIRVQFQFTSLRYRMCIIIINHLWWLWFISPMLLFGLYTESVEEINVLLMWWLPTIRQQLFGFGRATYRLGTGVGGSVKCRQWRKITATTAQLYTPFSRLWRQTEVQYNKQFSASPNCTCRVYACINEEFALPWSIWFLSFVEYPFSIYKEHVVHAERKKCDLVSSLIRFVRVTE